MLHAGRPLFAGLLLALVAACSTPEGGAINDPYEEQNRGVHRENKRLDETIVRPVATAYGEAVPAPVRRGISNFSNNLSLPGYVVNDLLQLRFEDAISNSARFLFNTTIGIGGIFDPATSIRIYERESDFGETLHVWGVGEGNYVELPLLGPSTERDAVGLVVDFAMNPLRGVFSDDLALADNTGFVLEKLDDRYEYTGLVDDLLYNSADSYAQARLLYLQNRRYQLGSSSGDTYFDPYADPYADGAAEPAAPDGGIYYDPYEDPYAQ